MEVGCVCGHVRAVFSPSGLSLVLTCLIIGSLQRFMETSCYRKKKTITTPHHRGGFSACQKLTQMPQAIGISLLWSEWAEMQWGRLENAFLVVFNSLGTAAVSVMTLVYIARPPGVPRTWWRVCLRATELNLSPRITKRLFWELGYLVRAFVWQLERAFHTLCEALFQWNYHEEPWEDPVLLMTLAVNSLRCLFLIYIC